MRKLARFLVATGVIGLIAAVTFPGLWLAATVDYRIGAAPLLLWAGLAYMAWRTHPSTIDQRDMNRRFEKIMRDNAMSGHQPARGRHQ